MIAVTSLGEPIHATAEGIENFWRWFGKSCAIDKQGRPLVVFHGGQKLTAWNSKGDESQIYGGHAAAVKRALGGALFESERFAIDNPVFFFTEDEHVAAGYGDQGENYEVRAQYLKIERPLDLRVDVVGQDVVRNSLARLFGMEDVDVRNYREISQSLRWNWSKIGLTVQAAGYDGIVIMDTDVRDRGRHTSWAVFKPNQIKCAVNNSGEFSLLNDDVTDDAWKVAIERLRPSNFQGSIATRPRG